MRILIIDDHQRLALMIKEGVEQRGFSCDVAHTLAAGEDAIAVAAFDAIILDLGLPDGDGVKWLAKIRSAGHLMPALVMTGRDGLGDKVAGLNAGADDYIVKPADIEEIVARLRALLRRPGLRSRPLLEFGNIVLDTLNQEVRCGETQMNFSRRETALLQVLMQHAGRVVSKSAIDHALYDFDSVVSPNAIEMVVSRLRKKLADVASGCELHTVRGVGYLLRKTA